MMLHITSRDSHLESLDSLIAKPAYAMIVPGYLILPYLVAPIVEIIVPYYLGVYLVRSKKASLRAGEECLKINEFDICWRYSDTLNNFTICSLMLFILSPETYKVMFCLVGFLLLIYFIDTYILLRQSSQTFYTTKRLYDAVSLWWSVPSGMLAAATVWWACRAEILPMQKAAYFCCGAFCVHIFVYLSLCKFSAYWVRARDLETTEYYEMCRTLDNEGKLWSFFNTNPIFCLRSYYLDLKEHGPSTPGEVVPYIPGKQHLQPGAPHHFRERHISHKKSLTSWGKLRGAVLGAFRIMEEKIEDIVHTVESGNDDDDVQESRSSPSKSEVQEVNSQSGTGSKQ